ncbi:hypothetical protein T492DRAFT_1097341 [Pavlovales sp. CCMP2436]|nr:hypothetical protein T492DRAFT_1097341 [Pavlovales sp. CCMP2436]
MRHRLTLPALVRAARSDAGRMRRCCVEVQDSAGLKALLSALLTAGNFVNAGSARAGAAGVHLDALEKAAMLRSADRRTTFLRTLAGMRRPAREAGRELAAEMPSLFEGGGDAGTTGELRSQVGGCRAALASVRHELALVPVGDVEEDIEQSLAGELDMPRRFKLVMADFADGAAAELLKLDEELSELEVAQRELSVFAGEEAGKADADDVLERVRAAVEHLRGA